jgi:DNA-binding XRE family transcriptional regulator
MTTYNIWKKKGSDIMGNNKMPRISLAAARVNANLTQEEVAKSMHINKGTVVNWESGKTAPDVNQFRALCQLYDMPGDYIFLP